MEKSPSRKTKKRCGKESFKKSKNRKDEGKCPLKRRRKKHVVKSANWVNESILGLMGVPCGSILHLLPSLSIWFENWRCIFVACQLLQSYSIKQSFTCSWKRLISSDECAQPSSFYWKITVLNAYGPMKFVFCWPISCLPEASFIIMSLSFLWSISYCSSWNFEWWRCYTTFDRENLSPSCTQCWNIN